MLKRELPAVLRMKFPRAIKVENTAYMDMRHDAYSGERVGVSTGIAPNDRIAVILIAECNLFNSTLNFVHVDKIYLAETISQEEGAF